MCFWKRRNRADKVAGVAGPGHRAGAPAPTCFWRCRWGVCAWVCYGQLRFLGLRVCVCVRVPEQLRGGGCGRGANAPCPLGGLEELGKRGSSAAGPGGNGLDGVGPWSESEEPLPTLCVPRRDAGR